MLKDSRVNVIFSELTTLTTRFLIRLGRCIKVTGA